MSELTNTTRLKLRNGQFGTVNVRCVSVSSNDDACVYTLNTTSNTSSGDRELGHMRESHIVELKERLKAVRLRVSANSEETIEAALQRIVQEQFPGWIVEIS